MYDINLFGGMFKEAEIVSMSENFLTELCKLLDDKMSVKVLEFYTNFEQSGLATSSEPIAQALTGKVKLMHEILDNTIRRNTVHLEVANRGILEFVQTLHIDSALNIIQNRNKAIDDLSWILDNKEYFTAYVEERRKTDYAEFLSAVENLEYATMATLAKMSEIGYNVQLERAGQLVRRVESNKVFFYSANEKKRPTRLAHLLGQLKNVEIILHGLRYNKECESLGIRRIDRRMFDLSSII